TDAQRERGDSNTGEGAAVAQRANRVTYVASQRIEPHPPRRFVEALLRDGDVAEAAPGLGPGLLVRHALLHQSYGFLLDVRRDFVAKVFRSSSRHAPRVWSGSGRLSTRTFVHRFFEINCQLSWIREPSSSSPTLTISTPIHPPLPTYGGK